MTSTYRALVTLVDAYDLAPVAAARKPDHVDVHVRSVAALEVFADAVEQPLVSEDGDHFHVMHDVDGVPTRFWAERNHPVGDNACTLQLVVNDDTGEPHYHWRFRAANGKHIARSSEIYRARRDMVRSAVLTFGLNGPEQVTPGAEWLGHGAERVVVEEVSA